jgi:SpoVK/Ycf46/Vps4 family AAA+-type ATPase
MSHWGDVIGLHAAKRAIHESLLFPSLLPSVCVGIRRLPSNILLYGPPGTGKTLLARVAAAESNLPLHCVSPSSILSMYLGEA